MESSWTIINLSVEDKFGYSDVVTGIFYLLKIGDKNTTGFVSVDIGDNFIEFNLLTENIVLNWLFSVINKNDIESLLVASEPIINNVPPNLPWLE